MSATGSARQTETLRDRFNGVADRLTNDLGSAWALIASVALVVVWALAGPIFQFSDTWQLFINTTTTVVTFWMVFVIQNSANRQGKATQLKLDEIIRSLADARDEFVHLDHESEAVIAARDREFEDLASANDGDTDAPDTGTRPAVGDAGRSPRRSSPGR
jgi:low affinity Fe/Cu permease